ncbi:MAG: 5-(carboxyamino)imidazole ribonucleotide mutase [Bacillota bacterium]
MTTKDSIHVGIVMGSDSDLKVMREASAVLDRLGVAHEVVIASAHRTPQRAMAYAETAAERGLKVIIAGAGAAAHLAGVLAAHTLIPVIGVPMNSTALGGVDSLYSTAQMPGGVPVATMAIDGAKNAGIFAAQILALADPDLAGRLAQFRQKQRTEVEAKAEKLASLGIDGYLAEKD